MRVSMVLSVRCSVRHVELSGASFDLTRFVAERPFGNAGYTAELVPAVPGSEREGRQGQAEEIIVRHREEGLEDRFRLQDYEKLYAYPDLYDAVVQDRLQCQSPRMLAATLQGALRIGQSSMGALRVLDLAAGNGVSGSELRSRGVEQLIGLDYFEIAKTAADRDRPGVYDAYEVGDISDRGRMRSLVEDQQLNALVCSGAMGHLPFDAFVDLWESFPPGAFISASYFDATSPDVRNPLDDPRSEVSRFFKAEQQAQRFTVTTSKTFTHRLSMAGEPFKAAALVGFKP